MNDYFDCPVDGESVAAVTKDVAELAYPDYLRHEILTGLVPSVEGIVAKFPVDLPVIVINTETTNDL